MTGRFNRPPVRARLALALGATLLALAAAEGALRAWFWSRGVGRSDIPDLLRQSRLAPAEVHTDTLFGIVQPSLFPDVVYELRPRVHGTFRAQPYRSNAFGLRGPETTIQKPREVFRIAGLGDSHMFGWGVGDGESYLDLLRARGLSIADGRRVEILNFGCPGYNTAIEAAVYEHKVRRFDPDLLLLHYVGNDDQLPHFLQMPRKLSPRDWYLGDLVLALLPSRPSRSGLSLLPHDPRETPADQREAAEDHYRYMLGAPGLHDAMTRIGELTSQDAIPVIAVMLGERREIVPLLESLGLTWLDAAPQFTEHLAHLGFELTQRNWRGIWDSTYKIPNDGHPTAEAHVAYAELLEIELEARGITSKAPRAFHPPTSG
jgi:hypothetical protein